MKLPGHAHTLSAFIFGFVRRRKTCHSRPRLPPGLCLCEQNHTTVDLAQLHQHITGRSLVFALAFCLVACSDTPAPERSSPPSAEFHQTHTPGVLSIPEEVKYLDALVARNNATLGIARQATRKASDSRVRVLAKRVISALEADNSQLQSWRKFWHPHTPLFRNWGELHGSQPVGVLPGSARYDVRWLQAMSRQAKGTMHLTQDYQNKLYRPELQWFAQELLKREEAWRASYDSLLRQFGP